MTYAAAVDALITADATILALLPGGVYIYQETGRKGFNREQLAKTFPINSPIMNAALVIYEAEEQADEQAVGSVMSTFTPFMLWFVDSGNAGFNTLEQAAARAYYLLHRQRITGAFQFLWTGTTKNKRDPLIENACSLFFNGKVYGLRKPTGVS